MMGEVSELDWLASFHAGERQTLEGFYREQYTDVDRAVGRILSGADRETVVHEVFLRILSDGELRQRLVGGSAASWIATVAKNHAIDYRRRANREIPHENAERHLKAAEPAGDGAAEARLLLERFRSEVLPSKWVPVFEACFVRQMSQREAARELGLSRTTLLYQQHRVRALLRAFLLEASP